MHLRSSTRPPGRTGQAPGRRPGRARRAIRELLTRELGQDPDAAFARFEIVPLAAASVGQAHAAKRHDGTEVIVKVRRPGVVQQAEEDLEILKNLAAHASQHWEAAHDYDTVGLTDEFAHTLRAELDYLREGRNAELFAANFAQNDEVHIPRVFWETTTSRVLTLERIHGIGSTTPTHSTLPASTAAPLLSWRPE